LGYFEKKSKNGRSPLEIYHSLLYIALCQQHLGYDPEIFIQSFSRAHVYRPSRAEALYELARYYNKIGNHIVAYLCAEKTMQFLNQGISFVEAWIHDWGARLYFFLTSLNLRYYDQSYAILEELSSIKIYRKQYAMILNWISTIIS